jgi:hypothetical protein
LTDILALQKMITNPNTFPIVYPNADMDKSSILSDNKGKAGIYQWTHILSGKKYVVVQLIYLYD